MKLYTIPEALTFLAEEYGANRMPTSQETLRRAIRTGDLLVQEEGDPGRKGYTISEADLRLIGDSLVKLVCDFAHSQILQAPLVRFTGSGNETGVHHHHLVNSLVSIHC